MAGITPPVALDAYAAKLIGFDVLTIPTIEMAARHKLGIADPAAWLVENLD